jgi:hypothetical protein
MPIVPGFVPDSTANFVRPPANGFGLRLYGSSSGHVGLRPAAAAGAVDFTLPAADGANTNVLQTNGSGILSFVAVGGAGAPTAQNLLAFIW